ncbi:MAG: hypothetical protein ACOCRX_02990 [Candidatus Woesearchaeota archaeon]
MVTISHLVLKYVEVRPFLQEAFMYDIISYASLAKRIRPNIEKELGKEVKHSAVVMALRRAKNKINKKNSGFDLKDSLELVLINNLCNVTLKNNSENQSIIDDKLDHNFIRIAGDKNIELIFNYQDEEKIKSIFNDKIKKRSFPLNMIKIKYDHRLREKPGVLSSISRILAWNDISINHIFTTSNEISLLLDESDSTKAYDLLSGLSKEKNNSII